MEHITTNPGAYRLPRFARAGSVTKNGAAAGKLSPEQYGRVLVPGGAFVDVTLSLDHMPPVGGDSYAEEKLVAIGGCALNVAHALRLMEIPHKLKVPIGTGPYAAIVHKQLLEDGYKGDDFIMVETVPGAAHNPDCGYCLCMVDAQGERTFVVVPGVENHFQPEWLSDVALDSYDMIYLSGFDLTETNGMVYLNKLKAEKPKDCTVFFDAGARVNFITDESFDALFSLDPIFHLNRLELELITGSTDPQEGLRQLCARTRSPVILSLDIDGALVACQGCNTIKHYPVVPRPVLDATGAGDSHSASIIAALCLGANLHDAITLGNEIAGMAIGQLGARITLPKDFSLPARLQALSHQAT